MRHSNSGKFRGCESLESRLLLNAPPEKFVIPVVGEEGVDWAVLTYPDEDPAAGSAVDYRGRQYARDGLSEAAFNIPNFAAMDRGVDVVAVAGGAVIEVRDGEFDRTVDFSKADQKLPDNYVLIDHGDGWQTRYGRLRNGSVAVAPGQVVKAGQKVAQVGGSGSVDAGAWMRFEVTKDGEAVSPFADAEAFWHSPPSYAGDSPGSFDHSVYPAHPTGSFPNELRDQLPRRHVFHPGEQ